MLELRRLAQIARYPLVALAVAASLGAAACSPATTQQPADPAPQEQQDPAATDSAAPTEALRLADLLADPTTAYDALEDAGLSWRGSGSPLYCAEGWPVAMADAEDSHPLYDVLAELGIEQPAVGDDYFVGPAYVCLGTGLVPSERADAALRTVLTPDDVAAGTAPDAIALCAPVSGRLSDEQLDALTEAAGLGRDASDFLFDDTGQTGVYTQARAGAVTVGESDCFWYVQQFGSNAEGGSSVLRMGVLSADAARALVDGSVLHASGQTGSWDDAASDDARLELLATAAAQEAIASSGSWTNVLTGQSMSWDSASGAWVAAE